MSDFTRVISTTDIDVVPPAEAVGKCPRELLGLICLAGTYECLCKDVATSEVATVQNEDGTPVAVNFTMHLKPHDGLSNVLHDVMRSIDMTGYKADFVTSRSEVRASFNLRRPENTSLVP